MVGYNDILFDQIINKINTGKKLDKAEIKSVFEILLKSNGPIPRGRATEVVIAIIDPKTPDRENKLSYARDVLLNLCSKPIQEKLSLQDSALPKIAYYLSHQDGHPTALKSDHQRAARALAGISKSHRLPQEVSKQLQAYKDSLASIISLRKQVGIKRSKNVKWISRSIKYPRNT